MASDYLDYENNLAFPPQEVKSQDDVKHQDTRSSDVLIKAVEECEKLEKENQQLKELLKECKHIIEWYKADYKDADVLNEDVITKIDNAIGEKK